MRTLSFDACWQLAKGPARFCVNPEYRSTVLTRLFNARDVHQTTLYTGLNRYPAIFAACQRYFEHRTELRLLSFGCSTGEEVLALRRYFPTAFITGAEINRRCLAYCRRLDVDDRTAFVRSTHDLIAARGPFDGIFCMAVLQRTPEDVERRQLANLTRIYPFEKFDRQLVRFDALLKPGGLLVIHHTQYDVADASVAGRYEPLQGAPLRAPASRFDRNGNRLALTPPGPTVFVKTRDA
jgi:hypothetical protein